MISLAERASASGGEIKASTAETVKVLEGRGLVERIARKHGYRLAVRDNDSRA